MIKYNNKSIRTKQKWNWFWLLTLMSRDIKTKTEKKTNNE